MPLLRLETTVVPGDVKALLASLSRIVAETIGKPEEYVMVTLNTAAVSMSGEAGEGAFVDVRSIGGLNRDINEALSQKISGVLQEQLGIPNTRVFLNFTELPAAHWGWQSKTLA